MRVDCALLCDAATVREGLLHILGGGVTRAPRPAFPAPMGVALALRIVVHPTETDSPHQGRILVQAEDGATLAQIEFMFTTDPSHLSVLEPGEEISLPVVVPLHMVGIPKPGGYGVEVLIDKIHQSSIPFRVTQQEVPDGQIPS